MQATLSVVIPTIGRASLADTLRSVAAQEGLPGDEVLLIGDGPQPRVREVAERVGGETGSRVHYIEEGPTRDWGGAQRNLGYQLARADYVLAIDDDDVFVPGAFALIRCRIAEHPGRALMFKVETRYGLLWARPVVALGNVGTGMLALPNNKARMGRWGSRYEGDFDFISATEGRWPGGFVWIPETIIVARRPWEVVRERHAAQ